MSPAPLLVLWSGVDEWRAEVAEVELGTAGVRARGTQAGGDPLPGRPYRLDYRLDAGEGFVTRRLDVTATGAGWSRALALERGADGRWTCAAAEDGGPPAVVERPDLAGALDCDLGGSPLTNLMPVRRLGLMRPGPPAEIVAAWVDVPALTVHPSRQRYEHVRDQVGGAVVRYTDLGAHAGVSAELLLDADGLVVGYPGLARRVGGGR
ncbi:putative glycolipid-binding domain-containing protein [Miltoncostaea marina]|uniref:putative glycolipid-binding domain-containing protein n=1 Tax=Miltoncostaea marina TaxID=2843215 RepID=UPI001C3D3A1E|nr:putative glycolipid-binding domain-containing protein [Miltoncostaea marina]